MRFTYVVGWILAVITVVQAQSKPQDIVARHGLTSVQYQSTFDELVKAGHRLTYVSGYTINNEERFAAIWERKPSPEWAARHGMTSEQYQTAFNDLVGKQFRLVLVNGYTVNGQDRYVAIWEKSSGPGWKALHGMSSATYQSNFNTFEAQGYRLKHISGYAIGNQDFYAAIWEQSGGPLYEARHFMTSAKYQQESDSLVQRGYLPVLVSGYSVNNVDFYAVIFEKSPRGPLIWKHGMSSASYQGEIWNDYYQGYHLKLVSGYTVDNDAKYAAIWENTAMSGDDLTKIENKITKYMTKWGIPGMSLAITQGERLVFARGFGLADKGKNINVNPTHRFRVASVSKPITATTLMYIIEKNPAKLSLNTPVFGPQGFLGKSPSYSDADFLGKGQIFNNLVNRITLQNLTEHRSGWADNVAPGGDSTDLLVLYGQTDFIPGPPPHAPSQNELIDYVLRKHPPYFGAEATRPIQYNYSNFGYSVIGRVIEKFSGKPYEQYVRETVLKESGITQMAIGKPGFKLDNEVQYYESDPRYNPDSIPIDKYDSFGGWVATPIELTRFMVATDNHGGYKDVVGTASELGMWDVATPGSNYGRGWLVGANQHGHNGILPGTGSFVWARDDIGIPYTFAIIGNQNAGYFKPVNDMSSGALLGNVSALLTEVNKWPSYDLF